jgi:hypothetical protein
MKSIKEINCNYNNFRKRHSKTFSKVIVGILIVFISFGFYYNPAQAGVGDWLGSKIDDLKFGWNTLGSAIEAIRTGGIASAITDKLVDEGSDYLMKSQKTWITNMVTSINEGLGGSTEEFFKVSNPLDKTETLAKFNMLKKISNRFFTLAVIFVIITILFDIKIGESEQRLRKLLYDILFGSIILNSIQPTLPYLINGASSFSSYFAGGLVTSDTILTIFTIGASSDFGIPDTSLILFTVGILILLLVVLVVILGLFIFTIGVNNMFAVLIIVSPLFIALYPTNYGKEVTKKILFFTGFLLCVGPLQALSITVCASNLGTGFTFINLLKSVAGLVFTVGAIPTFTYFLFNMAQQPKV